jgi:signal transduction histidine kinase
MRSNVNGDRGRSAVVTALEVAPPSLSPALRQATERRAETPDGAPTNGTRPFYPTVAGKDAWAHLRGHPWHATSIGPMDTWPESLRAALQLVLARHHAAAIAWGDDLMLIPNAHFVGLTRSLGCAEVIGQPMEVACSELHHRMSGLLSRARNRAEAGIAADELYCMYRSGRAEETYLTCVAAPFVDDGGASRGVVINVEETTERVLGRRRNAAIEDIAGEAGSGTTVLEGCVRTMAALSRHTEDLPFALVYLRQDGGGEVRLAVTSQLARGLRASPERMVLGGESSAGEWPVADAMLRGEPVTVTDLVERFGALPSGGWPFSPNQALVVPLMPAGAGAPAGALVAGVSARHALDDDYRRYIQLVAAQLTSAIAGGTIQEERLRRKYATAREARLRARRRARLAAVKARFAGMIDERTRLARELHDTLLHGVTAIALEAEAARPHLHASPERALRTLERIIPRAAQAGRAARLAVWDIRRPMLTNADFVRAVDTTAQRLVAGTATALQTKVTGRLCRLSAERQSVILRVVHEAVTNAVRHSRATHLLITLAYRSNDISVRVSDDGVGFVVSSAPDAYAGHWGLIGMRERAENAGGHVSIMSSPDHGTTIQLVLPHGHAPTVERVDSKLVGTQYPVAFAPRGD